jgi:hypothetical protein
MEKALAAMHQAIGHGQTLAFEYATEGGKVGLFVEFPEDAESIVTGPLLANYPHCTLTRADAEPLPPAWQSWSAELMLTPELFPILRHAQFEDLLNGNYADPINSVLGAIKPADTLRCRIILAIRPASHGRCRSAAKAVHRLDRHFFRTHSHLASYYARHITRSHGWFPAWLLGQLAVRPEHPARSPLDTSASRLHDREDDLQAAADKIGGHLFDANLRFIVHAPADKRSQALDRIRQMAGALGAFTRSRLATFRIGGVRRGRNRCARDLAFLLSHEELATLWHPPTSTVIAEKMQASEIIELEAPAVVYSGTEEGAVVLGRARFRDDRRQIGLALEDRRRHLYIVGKTGMGKTTLIQNQIAADLRAGRGVCLVDPHGDLAESIVRLVPKHRTNEAIVFDAGDREFVVAFNPLACRDPSRIDQVTSGVVSAFKKLHDSWGPRLEDTLRNAVFATVEQGGTMMSLMRLLAEKTYREQVVRSIRDEVVRSFWQHEFARWHDAYRTEAVAAIQNKIRPFLTNTNIRAIVSQPGRSLDLRQVMDEGKVLIVNLSKGRIGEDNATLLGAFLVTSIQQAAMTRADVPEENRRDFFLYVDEFQNFTTGSFPSVLSEARKFRLSLTVAHQYLTQLNEPTANAVWGNVGSIIAFQVGSDDAEILAQQLSKYPGHLKSQDLTNLPKYTAYARLLIDGMPSNPFSLTTLPPVAVDEDRYQIVYDRSQRQYARPVHPQPSSDASSSSVALPSHRTANATLPR